MSKTNSELSADLAAAIAAYDPATDPDNSALAAAVLDAVNGWAVGGAAITRTAADAASIIAQQNTFFQQAIAWYGGTATGGPNNDGRYNLTDVAGNTYLVPSPAKLAAELKAIEIGDEGPFSGRAAYDGEDEGFTYLSTDGEDGGGGPAVLYRKRAGAGVWSDPLPFQGPQGVTGDPGEEVSLQVTATHIQWRLGAGAWADLIALSALLGPQGDPGAEVSLQVTATHIQWRVGAGAWADLIALSALVGPQGLKGDTGSFANDFEGPWNSGTAYVGGKIVTHDGETWYAEAGSTNIPPGTDASKWSKLAARGADADLSLLPYACVGQYSSTDTTTNINADTEIVWNAVDIGDIVITVTGASITVAEDGLFDVYTSLAYENIGADDTDVRDSVGVYLEVNGVARSATGISGYVRSKDGHNEASTSISEVLALSVGDTLKVKTRRMAGADDCYLRANESVLKIVKVGGKSSLLAAQSIADVSGLQSALDEKADLVGGKLNPTQLPDDIQGNLLVSGTVDTPQLKAGAVSNAAVYLGSGSGNLLREYFTDVAIVNFTSIEGGTISVAMSLNCGNLSNQDVGVWIQLVVTPGGVREVYDVIDYQFENTNTAVFNFTNIPAGTGEYKIQAKYTNGRSTPTVDPAPDPRKWNLAITELKR